VERSEKPQLHMIWPRDATEAVVTVPPGYALRTYAPGDEDGFLRLMAHGQFDPWDEAKLRENVAKVIPGGWFFATEAGSGAIVATVMCLHDYTGRCPATGDVGWLACDPTHRGRGLGVSLTAAATNRFLEAGYRRIQLHTEAFRLAAVRSYLKVGYLPVADGPEARSSWAAVCARIDWPFRPEVWRAGTGGGSREAPSCRPLDLGEAHFGRYGSGESNRSTTHERRVREKLRVKHPG